MVEDQGDVPLTTATLHNTLMAQGWFASVVLAEVLAGLA